MKSEIVFEFSTERTPTTETTPTHTSSRMHDEEEDGVPSYAATYPNGDSYKGGFNMKSGLKEGRGTYTYVSGDVYRGSFAEGEKSGEGVYMHADGSQYCGQFMADMKSGEGSVSHTLSHLASHI